MLVPLHERRRKKLKGLKWLLSTKYTQYEAQIVEHENTNIRLQNMKSEQKRYSWAREF